MATRIGNTIIYSTFRLCPRLSSRKRRHEKSLLFIGRSLFTARTRHYDFNDVFRLLGRHYELHFFLNITYDKVETLNETQCFQCLWPCCSQQKKFYSATFFQQALVSILYIVYSLTKVPTIYKTFAHLK